MSDTDKTLRIKIETEATGQQGAAQVSEGLKEVTSRTEKAELSTRELRRIFHEMGNVVVPGLGHSLMELAYGPIGVSLALAGAFEFFHKKVEETDKEVEKLGQEEMTAHAEAVENFKKVWEEAKLAVEKYDAEIKQASISKDPAGDRLKSIKEVSAAETEAHAKRIEQLNKEYVLFLKGHGASEAQIAGAEEAGARQVENIKSGSALNSINELGKDIAARTERQKDFDATEHAEENRVARAKDAQNRALSEQKELNNPELIAKDQENVDKQSKAVEEITAVVGRMASDDPARVLAERQLAAAQSDLAAATAKQNEHAERRQKLEETVPAIGSELQAAQAAQAQASATGKANREAITSETTERAGAIKLQGQKSSDERLDQQLNEHISVMGANGQRTVETFSELALATGRSQEQVIALAQAIIDGHYQHLQVLKTLAQQATKHEQQIDILQQQQKNAGYSTQ
jgi:hypothetical protein